MTAREIVSSLKRRVPWLKIPGHVWLDVDAEKIDQNAMEEGVEGHQNFLLLLTKGYFTRPFCKLELQTAVACGANIALVHETDMSRGGYASFGDYITELNEQLAPGGLYADFQEAKDAVFGVNSVPVYHVDTLDEVGCAGAS